MKTGLIDFIRARDWRIWLGLVVTVLWLAGSIWYLMRINVRHSDQLLTIDAVGSFLEGVFAPLAFLWLVLGLFIQQRELANNTAVLRESTDQSIQQTKAIAATEMNARQETFFKIADNVKHQLGGISGMLYSSSTGPAGDGSMTREEMNDYFSRASNGDYEIFARLLITKTILDRESGTELFFGTEIRTRHSHNFMRTFDRLRHLARNCDVDGIILDSLNNTAFGLLYGRMRENDPALRDGRPAARISS